MGFTSAHGSITAATIPTTASIVGQYTQVRIANHAGGGDLWFRTDGIAAVAGGTSARVAATSGPYFWDVVSAPTGGAILPASVTTTFSLISNVTNTAYSITAW